MAHSPRMTPPSARHQTAKQHLQRRRRQHVFVCVPAPRIARTDRPSQTRQLRRDDAEQKRPARCRARARATRAARCRRIRRRDRASGAARADRSAVMNRSTPTIQNGIAATRTAVRPLGNRLFGPDDAAVAEAHEEDAEHRQRRPVRRRRNAFAPDLQHREDDRRRRPSSGIPPSAAAESSRARPESRDRWCPRAGRRPTQAT